MAAFIAGGSVSRAAGAPPEHKALRLDYRLDAPGAGCPSERELRALVAARLGFDPFEAGAPLRAQASIVAQRDRLRSELKLVDPAGRSLGERTLDAAADSCGALAESLALDLALAVDPSVLTQRAPAVEAAPPRAPTAEAAPRPRPDAPAPREPRAARATEPVSWSVGLGALGAAGLLPSSTLGFSLEGAARWGAYSLAVEGEIFPSSTAAAAGGEIDAALMRLGARACRHLDRFGLCLRGGGGVFHANGSGLNNPQAGSLAAAYAGPVGLAVWRPAAHLTIAASVALDVALIRNSVLVGSVEEWRSPPLAVVAGVRFGWASP